MAFDREERQQRATSFGGVAGAYERARPEILEHMQLTEEDLADPSKRPASASVLSRSAANASVIACERRSTSKRARNGDCVNASPSFGTMPPAIKMPPRAPS